MAAMNGNCYADAGVGIFIDNSNLWIEGKKAYAAKMGLNTSECPQWRLKMGDVVEQLVHGRNILPGGGQLYGSTPPSTPELWKHFSQVIEVKLRSRSFFTNKEKCIDVELASSVIEFACDNPNVTIILVTGDRDFMPVLEKLRRRKVPVEVWAWHKALSKEIRDFANDSITIGYLDEIIDMIGFTNDVWNQTLDDIPVENSMVFPSYAEKPIEIAELLASFLIPYHHFEVENSDLIIIFNYGLTPTMLCEYVQAGERLGAVSYFAWKQSRAAESKTLQCKITPFFKNSFGALDDEESDDEDDGKDVAGDEVNGFGSLDEPAEADWTRVTGTVKEDEELIYDLCRWGKYCKNYVSGKCRFMHTRKVHAYFTLSGQAKTPQSFAECTKQECHGPGRCKYWHKDLNQPRLCPTCDTLHVDQHELGQCEIILNFQTRKREEDEKRKEALSK